MRSSTLLIVIAMISGIAVLLALGTWQVKRLYWKDNLIAQTKARVSEAPLSLEQVEQQWNATTDVDYMAITLSGHYDHDKEMYYFNTLKGKSGWNVFTPFYLKDQRMVLVNRGFVPVHLREKSTRKNGYIEGEISLKGLARNPVYDKPNSFIPNNQLAKREFYWKSFSEMVSLAGDKTELQTIAFMVDAGAGDTKGIYPFGGTTRMEFPNNHLQYAFTWYGLALALLGVGSTFLYSRRKQSA